MTRYRGWAIWYDVKLEVWRAERYGVGMNASIKANLVSMIDQRVMRERERKEARGES